MVETEVRNKSKVTNLNKHKTEGWGEIFDFLSKNFDFNLLFQNCREVREKNLGMGLGWWV